MAKKLRNKAKPKGSKITLKKAKGAVRRMENPSLTMLATALKMEERGKNFYEKALFACRNDLGREIFTFLMNEEIIHVGRIKNIYQNVKAGRGWTDEWKDIQTKPIDLEHLFHEMAERHAKHIKADTGDLEALKIGLDFENRTVGFYVAELGKAKDPLERDFIDMMVLEEKRHVEILENMKQYVTDPEGWNAHVDRLRYDG